MAKIFLFTYKYGCVLSLNSVQTEAITPELLKNS